MIAIVAAIAEQDGKIVRRIKNLCQSRFFSVYGTLFLVILIMVLKSASGEGQVSLFNNLVNNYIEETSASVITVFQSQNQLADTNSLAALSGQNLGQGGEEPNNLDLSTIQENSLQASNPASTDYMDGFKADQVVKYTVQAGDTISSIASDFGVSVNTIIWANNLRNPNSLSLGQTLKIPPVTGVIHLVKNGDTVATIAKKYKADPNKILSFNNLKDDQALEIGNELMVPGGELSGPVPSVKSVAKSSDNHGIYVSVGNGQCVDFVQAHGFSKMSGNANTWKRYINTPVPVVGGVIVLRGGRYGHVALVTAVKPNSIQIVEQNYYGLYIIDHREISLSDKSIVGFIQ